ncbi:hypothetical protein RRV45_11280 [Bacillus sp. DTU_2020_1000418_1_SI_GHA_SEK_038]|uniref:hypothetical protein n=1 Tax=Bacillus sp. DTU_2020_1000418_1_SI_GHA_SEK_038 TaxID=3077585 RepID=UPI0028E60BF8|nr:hypothetical protein [Bacillus sp. DTU_2020_1000418_1_SI_GHA_SEK_038]WNS73509.1 hypothetical protein RRV45_11280 [Bacillus sp. DTU_2020_1000418_1_SI_GHA_SEK_038]
MEGIILIAVGFLIVFFLLKRRKWRRKFRLKYETIPANLGILKPRDKEIVKLLHSSLPSSYVSQLKNRVLQNNANWTDHDFDWTYFELKRYFILNSLLKTVPMFSERVDEIWHEMLMFTKDYERFSHKFYKEFLHHTPNIESKPIPGERAFFDWVYLSLFQSTTNSRMLWGGFLRHPIKPEILQDFLNLSEDELLNRYFRATEDWLDIKKYLISKMKLEISQAELMMNNNNEYSFSRISADKEYYKLLPAAVFFSMYSPKEFPHDMNPLIPIKQAKASGGGSSCYGYGCSSCSSKDSGSDSGGGSSCSSCGGGCSS